MPIRTIPFESITELHLQDMIDRGVREDHTLDFKRELKLSDSGKLDLLEDVTSMANASGGTIIYGAREGDGPKRGVIVGILPLSIEPDAFSLSVENLLRDNVDERVMGIRHGAFEVEGGHIYVVRIPASPLAPHLITLRSHRDRFFLRGSVSNQPMNARQIREVALRSESAYERAQKRIADRIAAITGMSIGRAERLNVGNSPIAGPEFIALHVLPLFPPLGGIDLSPRQLISDWNTVLPFGYTFTEKVEIDLSGLRAESGLGDTGPWCWTTLLRRGGVEFGEAQPGYRVPGQAPKMLDPFEIEGDVRNALNQARAIAEKGLLSIPFVISLQFRFVRGLVINPSGNRRMARRTISNQDIEIDPLPISSWDEADSALRMIFHTMWQAWGYSRSPSFNE
jgi:hypothetical protein